MRGIPAAYNIYPVNGIKTRVKCRTKRLKEKNGVALLIARLFLAQSKQHQRSGAILLSETLSLFLLFSLTA